jgi:hypothetical protein
MNMDEHPAWEGLFLDKPFEFRFGARPGNAEEFFYNSSEHEELMAHRHKIIASYPERHVFQGSAAKAAVDELAEWGGAPSMDCRELALLWEQDFLVLLADAQGKEVFQAGVVCFPSSWRPEEKVGLPIYAIHSPVPTLNERLGEQIDKFIAGIKPDTVWERVNWGLSRSAELNQHPDCEIPRLEPPFNLNQVWVRREDQVLFRLPKTRALIFGINVFNISVGEVASDKEGRAGLRRAIETMPEEIAEYKNLLKSREYLLALLDA